MIITNVTLVDARRNHRGTLVVEDGHIKEVEEHVRPLQEGIIDGEGLVLMPAFIDLHTHLRDPGQPEKEDMASGMQAALKGGFVHVCAMANTKPIVDEVKILQENLKKAEKLNLCGLTQVSAVTKGFQEEEEALVDVAALRPLTSMFSNDGKNLGEAKAMRKALVAAKEYDFLLSCHCEPEAPMAKGYMEMNREVGAPLHLCHISEKETLDAVRTYKEKGVRVTCEVTPHHLFASGMDYKVHPPFGEEKDVKALIEGIKEGIVDVLATDHAPHTKEDKQEGMPGLSNIEVAFAMYWKVFQEEGLSLSKLSEMLSRKPAELLGLPMGLLAPGMEASFILLNPHEKWTLDPKVFVSRGKNNPFGGRELLGRIIKTYRKGELKYDHGQA